MFTNVHQFFFLPHIVYFSACLTSNKLYWIEVHISPLAAFHTTYLSNKECMYEDQLADVFTRFYTSASWTVGELTGYRWMGPGHMETW